MLSPKILALDFDGVVVDSVEIKTRAMAALFACERDFVDEIVSLHRRLSGLPRRDKFALIYRDILKRPLSQAELRYLSDDFAAHVVEQVISCPMIAGAAELLSMCVGQMPIYVVSATPEAELTEIVVRRKLDRYFMRIYGSSRPKAEVLAKILAFHGNKPEELAFIGDSAADFVAARETGTRFIGVVGEGQENPFPSNVDVCPDLHAVAAYLIDGAGLRAQSARS